MAFSIWDENEDGTISCQHLGKVMRSLGQNPTSRDLKEMMQDVDTDGNNFHYSNLTMASKTNCTPVQYFPCNLVDIMGNLWTALTIYTLTLHTYDK